MKILEIFGENWLEFLEKCKIIKIWWMISIGQVKLSKLPAKPFAFGPKMNLILKTFKKFLIFFDQNLYGKLTFFTIFSKYFLDFWLRSESIDLWKITPDFYNNFSDFGGWVNVPLPTLLLFGIFPVSMNISSHPSFLQLKDPVSYKLIVRYRSKSL